MFNNYSVNPNQTLNISAVSGTILKTYTKSFMRRCHIRSELADELFSCEPNVADRSGRKKRAVVLQVMLCNEQELIAAVLWKDDFDELFNPEEEK